jgi:FkbM family methyltransferase
MKETTYKTIKHWDDNLIGKHVSKEITQLFEHFNDYNITTLSFIDIGGNVGKFYDEISKNYEVKKCEIVEASKILCEYMTDKYKDNSNITIHNIGLSDEEGEFYFGDESLQYYEETGIDGSDSQDINFGLSAAHFVENPPTHDYPGKTRFYNSTNFLDNLNKIPAQDIKFIKVDTESRDIQIVSSMTEYLVKNNISPIILFENNFRYFLTLEEGQKLIDDLCNKVGYHPVDLGKFEDNVFLLPLAK